MARVRYGIAVFPGSNCERDVHYAVSKLGNEVDFIWHETTRLSRYHCIVLPGGFSYGDYLRTGSIARFSPLMQALPEYLNNGGLVLGICNGFQILLEAGLLPGAMLPNKNLKFICKYVNISVERNDTPFTGNLHKDRILRIPVAHHAGNYFIDKDGLSDIEKKGLVLFRYCNESGRITEEANPNGSVNNIAGLINEKRNVLGMMPHPERAFELILKSTDGANIFNSISKSVASIQT